MSNDIQVLDKTLEEIIDQLKAEGCIVDNDAGNGPDCKAVCPGGVGKESHPGRVPGKI